MNLARSCAAWLLGPGSFLDYAERRRRFQFCILQFQSVGRLFLQLCNCAIVAARQPEARTVSLEPCTTSCGFEASETIPIPGADSIFSSRCGAISGRLRCGGGPQPVISRHRLRRLTSPGTA